MAIEQHVAMTALVGAELIDYLDAWVAETRPRSHAIRASRNAPCVRLVTMYDLLYGSSAHSVRAKASRLPSCIFSVRQMERQGSLLGRFTIMFAG